MSKIILNILLVIIIILLAFILFRENNLFMVNRVKVYGNKLITTEEILELADLDLSKEIFSINTKEVRARLLTHELIKDAKVSRYLPSAIKIKITEKDLIANISDSQLYALDSDGNIVETDELLALYDLPIITGTTFATDSLGKKIISEPMAVMIKILTALRTINLQAYHDISEIHYDKNYGILLYLRKKAIPIVFGMNDYSRKIVYFSTIYNYLQSQNELLTAKSIDVRFDGQVVIKN